MSFCCQLGYSIPNSSSSGSGAHQPASQTTLRTRPSSVRPRSTSSQLPARLRARICSAQAICLGVPVSGGSSRPSVSAATYRLNMIGRNLRWQSRQGRSEEHTSELQSRPHLVCRLLLEKKKKKKKKYNRNRKKKRMTEQENR